MTFFHDAGIGIFTDDKYNHLLGSWLQLPHRNRS